MGYNFHYCHLSSSDFNFYLLWLLFKSSNGIASRVLDLYCWYFHSWLNSFIPHDYTLIVGLNGSMVVSIKRKLKSLCSCSIKLKIIFYVSFLNTIYANVGSFICGPLSSFSWDMSKMQGFQFYSLFFFLLEKLID